jgi:hypothetical protein
MTKPLETEYEPMKFDPIDRRILFALGSGPLTGTRLVKRLLLNRFAPPVKVFQAHLDRLLRLGVITCSNLDDPARGQWALGEKALSLSSEERSQG